MSFHAPPVSDADADIRAAAAPAVAVLAGRIGLALGLFSGLLAAQSLLNLRFVSLVWLLPAALFPLALVTVVAGWKLSRGRGWAAIATTVLAVVLGLLVSVWTLLALTFGYFSLLSPMVALAALVSALLAGLSLGPCRRADEARARLLAAGLDFGV